jgi:hypothetical protein
MSDFDWKIWVVKGLKKGSLVGVFTFATYMLDYTKTTTFPPEYVAYVGVAILIAELVLNAIKHTLPTTETK